MAAIRLTNATRQGLEAVVRQSRDGRQIRRAQALLALADGQAVVTVARQLGCSRQAVYQLVRRFEARQPEHLAEALKLVLIVPDLS